MQKGMKNALAARQRHSLQFTLPIQYAEISMEKMERVGKRPKINAFKGRLVQKITRQIRRVRAIIFN